MVVTGGGFLVLLRHLPSLSDDRDVPGRGGGGFDDEVSEFVRNGVSVDRMHLQVTSELHTEGLGVPSSEISRNASLQNNASTKAAKAQDLETATLQNDDGDNEMAKDDSGSSDIKEQVNEDILNGDEPKREYSTHQDENKIWEMEDQLIMARTYIQIAQLHGNTRLLRELKLRIREIEKALGRSHRSFTVTLSTLQRMRAMEDTLSKARRAYPDCSATASKLRALARSKEDQLREQQTEASYLMQIAARTLPKGHHCLAMQLTSEYFSLDLKERELHSGNRLSIADLHHYAIFSDNILACAVAVNSTISTSKEPDKIAIHVVTDSLNYPAMVMWFLLNPPSPATVEIKKLDDFNWLPAEFSSMFKQNSMRDPRYSSGLNHLRFYLPELFPMLDKIVFLDHDVVVQRDLSSLWEIDLNGKVNGAVESCQVDVVSQRLDNLLNFTDPIINSNFDANGCIWAFGLNVFDLKEWRRQDLMLRYFEWFNLGKQRTLWKAGSLPLGQIVFYNHTMPLENRWHVLGLGKDESVGMKEVEDAAVLHYDGNRKPWLDIAIPKYRDFWSRFLNYDNIFLQQCNIHR